MPKDKAPGPDGYTSEFFVEAWQIVGHDFTVAIQSFFEKGFLPKGVNTTILALIPKKDEAKEMKDYRPISCCNVIYKVISKIIANRLKRILPKFIKGNQSAFVKDRLLIENLLLATEIVKDYHKVSGPSRCALKIDISKAFDSVQWGFLHRMLKAIDLPDRFIHWIKLCVTTATFSVQVNGELAGFFNSTRGLRQGCSLSPYLFVMCMNVLSAMLDKAANQKKFGFHPHCKNLNLTHLCFADDLMIFSDGKLRSLEGILEVFNTFSKISGLKISQEKSTIYLAGVSQTMRERLEQRFVFAYGDLPVRYLGLPLLTKRMNRSNYEPLLEKIRKRIGTWTVRFLSYAGRLQLIRSVLMSIINFWMSAFRLPRSCLDEIERLCSAFLWSGTDLNPRKAKVSWKDVCCPTNEGGLGLPNLREVNRVCVMKLGWRILTSKDSLWVNWVKNHLIRQGSFWSIPESMNGGSWMWKRILKAREKLKEFHRMEIRNGKDASFWFDSWSSIGRMIDVTGSRGTMEMGISLSASVADVL